MEADLLRFKLDQANVEISRLEQAMDMLQEALSRSYEAFRLIEAHNRHLLNTLTNLKALEPPAPITIYQGPTPEEQAVIYAATRWRSARNATDRFREDFFTTRALEESVDTLLAKQGRGAGGTGWPPGTIHG